ncbi:hypothetical protein J6894_04638 [Nakaseomyces glabratus]|nr:hypothetical protein J6894_04638 [Nakaseomyces glabratus]
MLFLLPALKCAVGGCSAVGGGSRQRPGSVRGSLYSKGGVLSHDSTLSNYYTQWSLLYYYSFVRWGKALFREGVLPVDANTNKYFFILTNSVNTRFLLVENNFKTFNNGSLGSRIDEERSEMRYVM